MLYSKQFSLTCFFVVLFLSITSSLGAQAISFSEISGFYPGLSGPIVGPDGETSGYYFTTSKQVERRRRIKGKKKSKVEIVDDYEMVLFDQDLNRIGSKVFRHQEGLSINSVAYNGTYLAVELLNHDTERKWIELIDAQAETIQKAMLTYSPYDKMQLSTGSSLMNMYGAINPLPNGFLIVSHDTGGKGMLSRSRYNIKFVPNDKEQDETWSLKTSAKSKDYEGAYFLGATDSVAVIASWSRPNMLSRKMDGLIRGINIATGKEDFRYERKESVEVAWLNAKIIGDEIILAGYNVGESGKVWTDPAKGVNLVRLDRNGVVLENKELSLEKDLASFLDIKGAGKVKGMGNLTLHNVGLTSEGEVAIACEFYKTFNGGLTARDGMVIYVDDQLEPKQVEIIEKGKSKDGRGLGLSGGINLASKKDLAARAKASGMFDFAGIDQQGGVVRVLYFSGDSQNKEDRQGSIYVTTLVDGKLNSEKINFDQKTDAARIFPAKRGYIMIMEYDQKTNSANVHLERTRF